MFHPLLPLLIGELPVTQLLLPQLKTNNNVDLAGLSLLLDQLKVYMPKPKDHPNNSPNNN